MTVNTDFAQVEIDEQQVNLTRFSLFFPEKRDFFLEGQGIFDFARRRRRRLRRRRCADHVLLSRRIGLERRAAGADRGGARLTGRVGPFSIGVLEHSDR